MKIKLLSICMLAGLITACSDEVTNDVQYYLDNPNVRAEKIAECANNPGEKAVSPNCLNAREAEKQAMLSGSDMPSIR
ncbi:EexN family lipoprotein [Vibrio parahaemolyticus]|uniref:EexN family lipoprotein n=1 Tax=Vibrio parahaemolyticus TaxID=670 RepID=UPI002809036D|nr:EexN family lipoprotein [Vibrio parahaemolyticus]EJE4644421.1 EexN family lipoprotein [Vibrio parahaemolyticus]ELA9292968.1 EexN family lipoprotein [Vibrio parahaemolyticus]MDS1925664.1 EexN family lipoprotein [Vibrio parahaemolyticus]HCG8016771.1 EexN family lipoprotein [Vibrio parahaemolyticus]